MSGDVHFVLIKGFQHKKKLNEVVAWLEENVVLGHGEAEKVDSTLPFEIPMGFPSRQEAEEFSEKLKELGCVIVTESLSERKARAAQETESHARAEIDAAQAGLAGKSAVQQGDTSIQQEGKDETAEEEDGGRPPWLIPAAAGLGVVVVALIVWMGGGKVDTEALSEWSDKVDLDIISMVQDQSKSGSPFSEVVGNMQRHIEQQNYSQEERVENSNVYMGEVRGEEPVRNRDTRKRNIAMLQISLAFNKNNRKAWRRLVEEYQMIRATLKVEEIRKEMVEIFGEEETAEILEENG